MWSELSHLARQMFGFRRGGIEAAPSAAVVATLKAMQFGLGRDHDDRVRSAVLIGSRGRMDEFTEMCAYAAANWRDLLVYTGLADDPNRWRVLVPAIVRWRGHAASYRTAPPEVLSATAIGIAKEWIGPGWRTDPVLRPLLDHLSQSPYERPHSDARMWLGDASVQVSATLKLSAAGGGTGTDSRAGGRTGGDDSAGAGHSEVVRRWSAAGYDPAQVARVLDETGRVVYVNAYTVADPQRAVDALSDLEQATMWQGVRAARYRPLPAQPAMPLPRAERFDVDTEFFA